MQYHRFGNNQLPDQVHQLIHLLHIYTDKSGFLLLLGFVSGQFLSFSGFLGFDDEITRSDGFLLRVFFYFCRLSRFFLCFRLCLDLLHAGLQINSDFRTEAVKALLKLSPGTLNDIYLFDIVTFFDEFPKLLLTALCLQQDLKPVLQNLIRTGFI